MRDVCQDMGQATTGGSEGAVPRMANCCTGSLRSRRAFLVVEAMLGGVLAVSCVASQPLCRMRDDG